MFPRLTRDLLAAADVLVELATLGELGLDERGVPMALEPEPGPGRPLPRRRDRCADGLGARSCATARGRDVPARR